MSLALGTMLAWASFFAFLIAGPANPFGAMSPGAAGRPGARTRCCRTTS